MTQTYTSANCSTLQILNFLFRPLLRGGGTIYSTGFFFLQSILTDRYIHRRELWVVSLKSPFSVESGIKKIFSNFFSLQRVIEVSIFVNSRRKSFVFIHIFRIFYEIFVIFAKSFLIFITTMLLGLHFSIMDACRLVLSESFAYRGLNFSEY